MPHAGEFSMLRRDMFRAILAGAGAGAASSKASARAASPDKSKVAYHLSDVEKVAFVLGNIKNHYDGTQGAVEIALVVHGPALAAFKIKGASAAVASRFEGLVQRGLTAHACANTMNGMDITLDDLLAGFYSADAGGVVKLAELQGQGYAYLRP
jgi:intracellular sulfur oxidation DsrE/DsrF family protein